MPRKAPLYRRKDSPYWWGYYYDRQQKRVIFNYEDRWFRSHKTLTHQRASMFPRGHPAKLDQSVTKP